MNKKFVEAWNKNKDDLREYFRTHKEREYDEYKKLVQLIIDKILNPEVDKIFNYTFGNLIEIDNGDYQGTLIYIFCEKSYQPDEYKHVSTFVDYGSCSGCDTLQSIQGYSGGLPNDEQVEDYMTLCLHLIQHCKYLYER